MELMGHFLTAFRMKFEFTVFLLENVLLEERKMFCDFHNYIKFFCSSFSWRFLKDSNEFSLIKLRAEKFRAKKEEIKRNNQYQMNETKL